jgi:hypothetical protein
MRKLSFDEICFGMVEGRTYLLQDKWDKIWPKPKRFDHYVVSKKWLAFVCEGGYWVVLNLETNRSPDYFDNGDWYITTED